MPFHFERVGSPFDGVCRCCRRRGPAPSARRVAVGPVKFECGCAVGNRPVSNSHLDVDLAETDPFHVGSERDRGL